VKKNNTQQETGTMKDNTKNWFVINQNIFSKCNTPHAQTIAVYIKINLK